STSTFVYLATYETPPFQVVKIQVGTVESLTVANAGTGTGTITSSPHRIDCGTTCTALFRNGSSVTLTATAAAGSTFEGWSGSCTGTSTTCTLSIIDGLNATATFTKAAETPPTPAPTPTETKFTVIGITGSGPVLTARVRVPKAGTVALSGTRKGGGKTVNACTKVTRKVSKAGVVSLTCKVNAATQTARRTGPVVLRLTSTYTPADGKRQTIVRIVRLSKIGPVEPVTG
ncbi:MAG: InlB B-repeat-containing protein, partial [Gaiellales bacterium]